MKRATTAVMAAALMLAASAASAAGTTITAFGATLGTNVVTVSGSATFVDAAVEVGTDAADSSVPGTDLTTATISRPVPTESSIRFSIGVGNQPSTNGVPAVPYFVWVFDVTSPTGSTARYQLLANRASSQDIASNQDPEFKLWTCDPEAPPPNCTETAVVSGAFTPTGLDADIPVNSIGATPGSVISGAGSNQIRVAPGGAAPDNGVVTAEFIAGASFDTMTQSDDYVVPGPTVQVGIAPAGTPAGSVLLTKPGTFKTDGTFTATMPKPSAGEYVVAASVCYTDDDCALQSTTVTV